MTDLITWLRSQRFFWHPELADEENGLRCTWNAALLHVERELERRDLVNAADRAAVQLLREGQG